MLNRTIAAKFAMISHYLINHKTKVHFEDTEESCSMIKLT